MNALTKAMDRSRGITNSAYDRAIQLKYSGAFTDQIVAPGVFSQEANQSRDRQRYALYRGWLYSAVHALGMEAAGQPVSVGRLKGAVAGDMTRATKSYLLSKMTKGIYSKAVHHEMEIVVDHPLIASLENPNPIQYRSQFVYDFVVNICLTGRAYVVKEEREGGGLEFYVIPTTWVKPDHKKGPFSGFRIANPDNPTSADNKPLDRTQVAMAHFPDPSDPLSAIAPASTQMAAVRIDDHIQTSQNNFFENGIFPSVLITIGRDPHPNVPAGVRPRLTGPQRRQVTSAIRKVVGGVANYGNPAVIDGLIEKIERLSATQTEMGWEKSEDKVKNRIMSAFGVHPYIVGEPMKIGGYAQAAKIEERFCKRVNSYLDMLSNLMTQFAAPASEKKDKLLVWWEKCEPHDPALYWQNMREARKNNDITRNEFRCKLGFPPVEEKVADRSKLLDTVGGMQTALQSLQGIGQGIVDPDAVAQVLSLFLEIPVEEARLLTGKVPKLGTDQESVRMLREMVEVMRKPVVVEFPKRSLARTVECEAI